MDISVKSLSSIDESPLVNKAWTDRDAAALVAVPCAIILRNHNPQIYISQIEGEDAFEQICLDMLARWTSHHRRLFMQ